MDHAAIFQSVGAAGWGTCAFADLTLSPEAREKVLALCPAPAGVFVAAFPYFPGKERLAGNLSLYARGEDYHRALLRRLGRAAEELQTLHPGHLFLPGTDSSPLDERQCAALAGLGLRGRHGLVILPPWGSWLFLGTILTDLPLSSAAAPAPDCPNCGACVRACPTGALGQAGFAPDRCLSHLTQRKGDLSPEEEEALRAHPLVWGCDCCQLACPCNQGAEQTYLPEFSGDGDVPYLPSLALSDLEGLSNRTFRAAYGDRAFAWRGPAVLRRNLRLKSRD